MSNFPTIPEFVNTPQEMAAALRAVKQSVEMLAGLRQGESRGAPMVFVQPFQPSPARSISYKVGDLWINDQSHVISYWTGTAWQATA